MDEAAAIGLWPMRTGPAIEAEMSSLWGLLRRMSAHGAADEDTEEAIEAQLSVLSERLTPARTAVEFDARYTEESVARAALKASQWLQGIGEPPSLEWNRILDNGPRTH